MNRQIIGVIIVSVFFVAVTAGIGVAQDELQFVRGEPDLDVYTPEPTLTPGSTSDLTVQVANDGEVRSGAVAQREIVTTARSVTIEIEDDDVPFTVETQRQSIGSVADGDVRDIPIRITVPEDVEPDEYSLDVRLRYSHTFLFAPRSGVTQERSRTVRDSIDVTIDDSPRFEIETIESDVQAGDSGTLVTEVTNVGGETARDLTIGLESTSGDVTLGETPQNTARIDQLESGENTTLTYDANIRSGTTLRNITLSGTVAFTDSNGIHQTQDGISVGVSPRNEQEFSLSVNESTLRVGEMGIVQGTIRNDGPADVSNVLLRLGEAQFEPRTPTYSIGELAAGDSTIFQFRGTVPTEADAVPQRIDLITQYQTPTNNNRETENSIHVPVADRRDAVEVTAVESQFAAGEEGVLELAITNQRDIEIRDVRLRLNVEEPLESDFRTTVISSLQPGETDHVAFDLEIDSDAPRSQFPATVEVDYIDHDEDQNTARPSTVAITVIETDGDDLPVELIIFGVLVFLVAAGAWWFYGR